MSKAHKELLLCFVAIPVTSFVAAFLVALRWLW